MTTRTAHRHLAATLILGAVLSTTIDSVPPVSAAPPPPTPCVGNVCLVIVNLEADSDGDGFTDVDEKAAGTDPDDPSSHPPALDVIVGVFTGSTDSFWVDHATELVVVPLIAPDGKHVATGLGDFMMPTRSNEEKAGLTLHQSFGLDVPGFTIDPGQSLVSSGAASPGSRFSLVAAGGSGGRATDFSFDKDGVGSGTVLSFGNDGRGTLTGVVNGAGADGTRTSTRSDEKVNVDADGGVHPTGEKTTTTTTTTPPNTTSAYPDSNSYSTTSTTTVDADGKTTYSYVSDTVTHSDGTSTTTWNSTTNHSDGSTTRTTGSVTKDKNGEVVVGSSTTTTTDASGKVTSETKVDEKQVKYSDPSLDEAMGWTTFLTKDDFARVAARMGSTIHTVEGWTPPAIDGGIAPTTSPKGPLVMLIDPESAVTTLSAGAPRFTSAQPEYDPHLNEIIGDVTGSGQLPPGTSPYTGGDLP